MEETGSSNNAQPEKTDMEENGASVPQNLDTPVLDILEESGDETLPDPARFKILDGASPGAAPEAEPQDETGAVGETPAETNRNGILIFPETGFIKDTPGDTPFFTETITPPKSLSKTKTKWKARFFIALALCTIGACFLGAGYAIGRSAFQFLIMPGFARLMPYAESPGESTPTSEEEANVPGSGSSAGAAKGSLSGVYLAVEPSVCTIETTVSGTDNIFGMPGEQSGSGSGIIFFETDDFVYIATNNHVTSGASNVMVGIGECEPVPASLVGSEPNSDLAVISVTKEDLRKVGVSSVTPAVFGDSDLMKVGDTVMAIGNAMGEGNTATAGIVSAINKEIPIAGLTLQVIQTNAAINHGNSGGPLVTMTGEVIGMNTAKLKQTDRDEFVEGMGYSIPSNDMLPILEAIMRGENQTQPVTVRQNDRAVMGIRVRDTELAAGAVIWEVIPGGSAERAGLLAGDIILELNGAEITSGNNLVNALNAYRPGDTVILHILRETEGLDIGVTLISASELENLG